MAGFQTHIATSTALGVGYAAVAAGYYGMPLPACVLAGGLCSISGMLPDLDSDSGVPLRESIAFAAAVVPMMMVERFKQLHLAPESIILAGGAIYLFIRFGLAKALRKYTVHRGMFHSLPAALVAAEVAFLVCARDDLTMRYFNAGAVLLGFMSHLVLDEIWSLKFGWTGLRFKKSFGTAVKFWSDSNWANVSVYAKVAILSYLAWNDPIWMKEAERATAETAPHIARDGFDEFGVRMAPSFNTGQRFEQPPLNPLQPRIVRQPGDVELR